MKINKYSFWKLIDTYSIHIPIIQRDFAQGRVEEKPLALRFLSDLKDSILQKKPLNLDFVYGRIEDQQILTPLDGQQRLTTLYLLHWYIALKEDMLTPETQNTLARFTYQTRTGAEDFCKYLVMNGISHLGTTESIREKIIDSKWFFLSWLKDPTVDSMLNMLEYIHGQFGGIEQDIFEQLINLDDPIITFHFLPLDQFNLSDELYIKMNARGKPITPFEQIKATLSKYISDPEDKSKLDNEWLDVFWKIANQEKELVSKNVDNMFFTLLQNITLNFLAEKNFLIEGKKQLPEFGDKDNLFDYYDKVYTNPEKINQLISILNGIVNYDDDSDYFSSIINLGRAATVHQRLRFYALMQFFIKIGPVNESNLRAYKRWMRVTHNLISNTRTEIPRDNVAAIRSIKSLSNNIHDIYEHVSSDPKNIDYFSKIQRIEESLKTSLILEDDSWNDLFNRVEGHPYFDGQIGFILQFSMDDEEYSQLKFDDYSEKLMLLFSEGFQEEHNFLFQRALLTFGDYLPQVGRGNNYTFCTFEPALRAKNENWRKVFNDQLGSRQIHSLLDSTQLISMRADLDRIVASYSEINWRYYFVHNPNYIEYCGLRQIRSWDKITFYLLSKTQRNGFHKELYSLDLFKHKLEGTHFQPFIPTDYFASTSDRPPCVYLDGWKYKKRLFALDIRFQSGFNLRFFNRNDEPYPEEIIEALEKLGFIETTTKDKIDYILTLESRDHDEIVAQLLSVCTVLNAIAVI